MHMSVPEVCVYNGRKYYQSQTWTVGCDLECICDDAGVGLYACQSKSVDSELVSRFKQL